MSKAIPLALLWMPIAAGAQVLAAGSLADMSLEELANLEVTSVSRRTERLADAAAAIYVITGEDIRRSGVTSLPEALRLAPNLQVARIDAGQYAISSRGFNNAIGNKLLVLIDGRTAYSPLFSGVFWDQQDVMLEDVERIEVISGPGGTIWGANAVNGVINVITRSSSDTQGALGSAGAGNREHGVDVRHGGKVGEGNYRVYAKTQRFQNTVTASGTPVRDGLDRAQVGFRADGGTRASNFALQGDTYTGKYDVRPGLRPVEFSGANLVARWQGVAADGSDFRLQAYVDHTDRDDPLLYRPTVDILDIEGQRGWKLGRHSLIGGAGYRFSRDDVQPGTFFSFVPVSRELNWANIFIQDEYSLLPSLKLTAGLKLEHNDYTGVEPLPSVRLAWKLADAHLLWGAISRAVRAPARLDHDIRLPANPPFLIVGGQDFESEIADVYELGYRAQPWRTVNYSVTAFRYEWDQLRSGQPPPATVQNRIQGSTYGVEMWGTWQALTWWRLSGGLSTLRKNLGVEPGANDPTGPSALGNDPNYQWQVRSSMNLPGRTELDMMLRRVGDLPNPIVPAYSAFDLRYAWRASRALELSATAQNLFDHQHPEFGAPATRSDIERGLFLRARWEQ